jgi:hypothetical protein
MHISPALPERTDVTDLSLDTLSPALSGALKHAFEMNRHLNERLSLAEIAIMKLERLAEVQQDAIKTLRKEFRDSEDVFGRR